MAEAKPSDPAPREQESRIAGLYRERGRDPTYGAPSVHCYCKVSTPYQHLVKASKYWRDVRRQRPYVAADTLPTPVNAGPQSAITTGSQTRGVGWPAGNRVEERRHD